MTMMMSESQSRKSQAHASAIQDTEESLLRTQFK
jgi:hypothetical protein